MSKTNVLMLFISFFVAINISKGQTLECSPTYNSIGYKITDILGVDLVKVEYKKASESSWLLAYTPDLIQISGVDQYRGSIFMLDEATLYDTRVTVYTSSGANVLPVQQHSTLSPPSFNQTSDVKWVSPNGTGDFSAGNPGNLATLFSTAGLVNCGTTVLLTNGVYKQTNLQLSINTDCTENSPIIIMAAPGATPIVDGGEAVTSDWTPHATIPNLYAATLPPTTGHSTICVFGDRALYPYPSVNPEPLMGNYNLSNLNFGFDGFVRDATTIWIKTLNGDDPNNFNVIVSGASRFLTVYGDDREAYLKIKGITFQHFGKPILNALGNAQDSFGAIVLDIRRTSHVYVDNCRFNYNSGNINFSGVCNNFTIQNSLFKHDAGKWSHAMIKKSNDFVNTIIGTISSTRARSVENAAIFIDQGKIGVIRGCNFNGMNSGVESYFDSGFKEELDIYGNMFIDNFDAIENDGLCSNLRVWNNEIIRPMAGFSVAPPLIGPRYFYRNLVQGMKGRRNEQDDPYFIGCEPISGQNFRSQGIGIKTNSGYTGTVAQGNLYFFNNTFHAADSLGFVMTLWTDEWETATLINNSYSHATSNPFFYFDLANSVNSDFQLSSQNENYFSFNATSPIVTAKHIYGQFQCTDIMDVSLMQTTLSSISTSANIEIQSPFQNDPGFLDMNIGGFEINNGSSLVDAGALIPGFYDYNGFAPDIGAKESDGQSGLKEMNSDSFVIYPNPSTGLFSFKSAKGLKEFNLEVHNYLGQQLLSKQNFNIDEVLNISSLPSGVYIFTLQSSIGNSSYRVVKF